ncbi:fungal-specific transcription factor domain-containing protein [Aspergillus germanicus]
MTQASVANSRLPAVRRHRPGLSRSVAACERCRRRKQKCDGKTPTCGPCESVGASCVPSRRLVVQAHSGCECDSLRARLLSLQKEYDALLLEADQLRTQRRSESVRFDTTARNVTSSGALRTSSGLGTPEAGHGLATPSDPLILNLDLSYTGRILRPTFTPQPNFRDSYRSALSSAWYLWGDDAADLNVITSQGSADPSGFDNATFVNLVEAFFERRWPYLPVLHQPTFISEHLNPYLARSVTSPISNFLVNMVCAITATERSPTQDENSQLHRLFLSRAVQDLHIVIQADDFECIQCLLLLCMYGHNEPQSVNMWYTTGLALQLALGIDLHRKESLAGQNLLRSEMLKRVFWCAYVMSCSMAINMGRPLGIHENDITVPLPLPLKDEQLNESFTTPDAPLLPRIKDTSTFIHIVQLRKINARVYTSFHSISTSRSIGQTPTNPNELEAARGAFCSELNYWLMMAPRYVRTSSTFQSQEWFQIAFHHAMLSLYRPSRAVPMPSSEDLRLCMESAIGLINSYSSLYARNRIKYTFVAIHSLFMAAVTMLYALRSSPPLRHELSKPVVQTNILTFLTLFHGISNGRAVGEKCSSIIERLGNSILTLFDEPDPAGADLDTEFQSWFGLQTHTFPTPRSEDPVEELSGQFPDVRVDIPWADLFVEGVGMGSTDAWCFLP